VLVVPADPLDQRRSRLVPVDSFLWATSLKDEWLSSESSTRSCAILAECGFDISNLER